MPFQMPITIARVLQGIQTQDYVLPAIQREFVWGPDQIARLFDSLLRDYPIGSFLFWKVDGAQSGDFKFYGFIKDYHQLSASHCPVLDVPVGKPVTAILDGQQRLTSLTIGLRGSHAVRLPGKWWKNASSYPRKTLHLNLCQEAPENEQGMIYDFRFFVAPPPSDPSNGSHWFPVHRILDDPTLGDASGLFEYVLDNGLNTDKRAFRLLTQLHKVVHDAPLINFYEEHAPDLDKVLDIFIRVNSGGTVLSYSDLLLSIATAQWDELDARDEIHSLVDELNGIGSGFAFSKDVVLKAGLVLTEVSDVGFKVTNFNRANMAKLEDNWAAIEKALRLAADLLADFGFSAASLTANSVLIPVAYYMYRRGYGDDYRLASKFDDDREQLRRWVVRTLVKPGVWGSGLDTLLRELRRVLANEGSIGFPTVAIESAMAARGKPLTFTQEEITDLVETSYGDKRAFALLALLFPHVDTRNRFHVDHVFPRALFKRTALLDAGVPAEHVDEYTQLVNGLPNLQLLEGQTNVEKQATLPLTWAETKYTDKDKLQHYLDTQDLIGLPATLRGFIDFYEMRKQRLADRLRSTLGFVTSASFEPSPAAVTGPYTESQQTGDDVAAPLVENGNDASHQHVEVIRDMLMRIAIPNGQTVLYQALYAAGDHAMSAAELRHATGTTVPQFTGVLGALGRRINQTNGVHAKTGINLVFDVRELPSGECCYRLRPEARHLLVEEGIV